MNRVRIAFNPAKIDEFGPGIPGGSFAQAERIDQPGDFHASLSSYDAVCSGKSEAASQVTNDYLGQCCSTIAREKPEHRARHGNGPLRASATGEQFQ
ncbi:MAG: hypothetical protein L0387_19365 [Acidobacteria bacterium]|nr:hypothetical protein [Acidobacteriota bacterium]